MFVGIGNQLEKNHDFMENDIFRAFRKCTHGSRYINGSHSAFGHVQMVTYLPSQKVCIITHLLCERLWLPSPSFKMQWCK